MTSDDTIQDYTNRQQVQTCELVHLAEYVLFLCYIIFIFTNQRCLGTRSLATEKEYVRARLVEYSNDLLSLGVEGLRLDAVKRTLRNILHFTCLAEELYRYCGDRCPEYDKTFESDATYYSRSEVVLQFPDSIKFLADADFTISYHR
jgi:hypothetical protein